MIFWIIVFFLARSLFLVYYYNLFKAEQIPVSEILLTYWFAMPLDISTASYLMGFTFLLTATLFFVKSKIIVIADKVYMVIALAAFSLITCGELGIYEEWRTKLNIKAVTYLKNPGEVYESASSITFFILVLLLILQISLWYYIYLRYFQLKAEKFRFKIIPFLAFVVFGGGVLFIGIRGGIDEIPINQSKSYFSGFTILNHAATNSANSFLYSYLESREFENVNPFLFFDPDEARQITSELLAVEKDTTIKILKVNRPNIVVILLEGWSADAIESLGGDTGITPNFKRLEQEGILFTQHYASGNRSDQGNVAVISGFPATPISSIAHTPEKSQKLPGLVKILKNEGYASSYYFGGQLIYGGIKSYIMSNAFDNVYEMEDFEKHYPRGKLGIHDEYMLQEHLNGISKLKEPFFSMIFTVSSHSPYDFPREKIIQFASMENEYLNSVHYADRCLGDYFKQAVTTNWYKNTLFIIVSDHGHGSQRNHSVLSKEYRKIPLLFLGDVIKDEFKGTQMARICSQIDIPSTLLHQLNIPSQEFSWSRNLFNPVTREFAYYEATEGIGWISPDGYFVYHRQMNDYFQKQISPEKEEQVIKTGKAYLQVLFQEYIDY